MQLNVKILKKRRNFLNNSMLLGTESYNTGSCSKFGYSDDDGAEDVAVFRSISLPLPPLPKS